MHNRKVAGKYFFAVFSGVEVQFYFFYV